MSREAWIDEEKVYGISIEGLVVAWNSQLVILVLHMFSQGDKRCLSWRSSRQRGARKMALVGG